jgi:acyl-CoA synthetase (AMP-forming)/AMP-acid ligase II
VPRVESVHVSARAGRLTDLRFEHAVLDQLCHYLRQVHSADAGSFEAWLDPLRARFRTQHSEQCRGVEQDEKWGEVPVAVIARNDERLTADELHAKCRRELAGYKQPKDIRFVAFADLPRSTTGKIQRHEVEAWLRRQGPE